jgi:hypothetical protein
MQQQALIEAAQQQLIAVSTRSTIRATQRSLLHEDSVNIDCNSKQ